MSGLKHENQITARTAPEVLEGVNLALARLQRAGVKFRGRKIGIEGLVGAVILDFLSRTAVGQDALLAERLGQLESMLGTEGSDQDGGEAGKPDVGSVAHEEIPPGRKHREA